MTGFAGWGGAAAEEAGVTLNIVGDDHSGDSTRKNEGEGKGSGGGGVKARGRLLYNQRKHHRTKAKKGRFAAFASWVEQTFGAELTSKMTSSSVASLSTS